MIGSNLLSADQDPNLVQQTRQWQQCSRPLQGAQPCELLGSMHQALRCAAAFRMTSVLWFMGLPLSFIQPCVACSASTSQRSCKNIWSSRWKTDVSSFPVPKVTPFLFIANMQPDVSLGQPHFPANTTLRVCARNAFQVALQNRLISSGSGSHRLQRCVNYLVIVKQNCTLAIIHALSKEWLPVVTWAGNLPAWLSSTVTFMLPP